VISSRRPLANTFAIALVAVLGVSACTSDPSANRVAQDLVSTQTQGFPDIEDCMLGVIDDYDLNGLGDDATSDNTEISGPAAAELKKFEADLVACDPEGVTRTGAPVSAP
jgi:hypothetical protein